MIITSFFTYNSSPATGLNPLPTINIWSVNGTTSTQVISGESLLEIGDGFYQFYFVTYDPTQMYVFRVDGGSTYTNDVSERYQSGSIQVATLEDTQVTDISDSVWNSVSSNYTTSGTMGMLENQIGANTVAIANNLYVNANSVLDIVNLIVKYNTNRTKIDPASMTLTVYDDDCITPLRTFQLLDTNGAPSITQVAERTPISATDGLPNC
jgi:hypothetical protein